ncbi:hypothetical protein [Fusobacterium sp. THCT1E2]
MKKLLLLAGILAISGAALGAGMSDSAELNVKAEIIKPLKVTTSPVDFGILTQGQTNATEEKAGEIRIEGEKGKVVSIELENLVEPNYLGHNSGVTLVNINDESSTLNAILYSIDKFRANASRLPIGSVFKDNFAIEENNSLVFPVTGLIKSVPEDAASGTYNGTITVNVRYNFNGSLDAQK